MSLKNSAKTADYFPPRSSFTVQQQATANNKYVLLCKNKKLRLYQHISKKNSDVSRINYDPL